MILFTFLIITLFILAIAAIIFGFIVGTGFIVIFGDAIVCVLIILLIIRHFTKKK